MKDDFLAIHRLFRKAQQQNRAVGEVSLAEMHFLIEHQADPSRSAKELVSVLGLEQSAVSRLASRLERQGMLKSVPHEVDRRRKVLSLTPKGKKFVQEVDKRANKILSEREQSLNKKELKTLLEFYKRIADGSEQAPALARETDHPLRPELRRVTRHFGLLSHSFMSLDIAPSQWHVLAEICLTPVPPTAGRLSELLTIAPNTISQIIGSMERRKLIRRRTSSRDKREQELHPTEKGKRFLTTIEGKAVESLRAALVDMSDERIHEFRRALEKFVGLESVLLNQEIDVTLSEDESELQGLRSFLLKNICRAGHEEYAPPEIAHPSATLVSAYRHQKLIGCLQFASTKSATELNLGAWTAELDADQLLRQFLFEALHLLGERNRKKRIDISFPPLVTLSEAK